MKWNGKPDCCLVCNGRVGAPCVRRPRRGHLMPLALDRGGRQRPARMRKRSDVDLGRLTGDVLRTLSARELDSIKALFAEQPGAIERLLADESVGATDESVGSKHIVELSIHAAPLFAQSVALGYCYRCGSEEHGADACSAESARIAPAEAN